MGKGLRITGFLAASAAAAAMAGGAWFYSRLRASLPILDGDARLPGLSAPVIVERDALGVPTIRGANRADVARALGFVHAQDRFFKMDVMRRSAAGELAALFGKAAVPLDKRARWHPFRALASEVAARESPKNRALIAAYTQGVNEGLAALKAKPFEYCVLMADPEPWQAEDCVLFGYATSLALQSDDGQYERMLTALRDVYGKQALAFFAPTATPEDAALDGSTGQIGPVPPSTTIDLRRIARDVRAHPGGESGDERGRIAGSNSLAIGGRLSADGSAVLANDMHLDLAVPNMWYRASLEWGGHRVTGVTLAGVPIVIAGSNGHVAWGFTNSHVDTGDLIVVTPEKEEGYYVVPGSEGFRKFEKRREVIEVKGSSPVEVEYDWTVWGPIIGKDEDGHPLAYHWTVDDPATTNFNLVQMEEARSVDDAIEVAHRSGIPAQNILIADSAGHIAWTIAGFLPKRVGYDGRLPVSWLYGDRGWAGYLASSEVPVVRDPSPPYLWTANNRIVGGRALSLLGDGNYDRPARAAQIRDRLRALADRGSAQAKDLLDIELDDRALFLSRWHDLLLEVLTPDAVAGKSIRKEMRAVAERWDGRASLGSASYRLTKEFRWAVMRRALDPIFAPCAETDPEFHWSQLNCEDAVWTLVHAKPMHLLDTAYGSWDDLLVAAADDAGTLLASSAGSVSAATWGRHNTLRMRHPFGNIFPSWMTGWLNMPAEELPGDSDMPRVQRPDFGASERFAVSPGHEAEGVFEMPGGESGHPLSPFFRAGHEAWAHGEAAPFLPGKPVHRLFLRP